MGVIPGAHHSNEEGRRSPCGLLGAVVSWRPCRPRSGLAS